MPKEHLYQTNLNWTGNTGEGTKSFVGYSRAHEISVNGKPLISGSSDPHFRGDAARYNPEEMLVASLSACHMLWYLHLCAEAGVVVTDYKDQATGRMIETENGGGRFVEVTLQPRVIISIESDITSANALHHKAHDLCFIANSMNFPVRAEAVISAE